MSKRAKRAKEAIPEHSAGPETEPAPPNAEVSGFEFELKKSGTPAVVKFFCMAVGCPGYPHKASEIAHPFGTCGAIVNSIDVKTFENAAIDEPDALPPVIEPPPLTEPGHQIPDMLASLPETGFDSGALAPVLLEQNAATSHDMPALDDDQWEGAIEEIKQTIGWKPPEASTMAVEPEQKQPAEAALVTTEAPTLPEPEPVALPVEWQPPKAPEVPPPPPAGTILRRDDSLGDQPDFVEVLDAKTLRKVVVYVYPNVHLPTTYLFRDYTPYDFVGLVVVEELPSWALEIREVLAGLPPLKAKEIPALAAPEQPPKPAEEPLPPDGLERAPVGSCWRRDYEGLEPDFLQVLDDRNPQTCVIYQLEQGTVQCFPAYHWPDIFEKMTRIESLPDWAQRLREEWLARDVVSQPTPSSPGTPDEPPPPVELEQETAAPAPAAASEDATEQYLPQIGSFWTCGESLIEVLAINEVPPNTFVAVGMRWVWCAEYTSHDGPIQFSTEGSTTTDWVSACDFSPGKIEVCGFCPPPWVLDARLQRALSVLQDASEDAVRQLNDGKNPFDVERAAQSAIEDATPADPPPLPSFSASDGTTPHPLLSIAAVLHELATELDVKPLHVMRALETGLQTFGQLLTFREMAASSPAVDAFIRLVSGNISKQGGLFTVLRETVARSVASTVDDRIAVYLPDMDKRLIELERCTTSVNSPEKSGVSADPETIAALRKVCQNDAREVVGKAFEAWELKHKSAAQPDDWADIAKDLGKVEDRLFRAEGELKRVLDELKDFNRSRKLEAHDPKTNSQRSKAFQERKKEAEREKRENLAKLRAQKAADAAIERGEKPKAVKGKPFKSKDNRPTKHVPGFGPDVPRGLKKPPKTPAESAVVGFSKNTKAIDKFMGKAKDPKVRAMLGRLPPSQLPKFLEEAAKGKIAVEISHWNSSELGTFAKWFYATTNKR